MWPSVSILSYTYVHMYVYEQTTEDEMAGWHHCLDRRESEWTPWVGDGQGGLACCDSWGHKESHTTEQLNWTELLIMNIKVKQVRHKIWNKNINYNILFQCNMLLISLSLNHWLCFFDKTMWHIWICLNLPCHWAEHSDTAASSSCGQTPTGLSYKNLQIM